MKDIIDTDFWDIAIQTYHGVSDGWQTIAYRSKEEAPRFLKVLSLVRPNFIHRAI